MQDGPSVFIDKLFISLLLQKTKQLIVIRALNHFNVAIDVGN